MIKTSGDGNDDGGDDDGRGDRGDGNGGDGESGDGGEGGDGGLVIVVLVVVVVSLVILEMVMVMMLSGCGGRANAVGLQSAGPPVYRARRRAAIFYQHGVGFLPHVEQPPGQGGASAARGPAAGPASFFPDRRRPATTCRGPASPGRTARRPCVSLGR